MSKANQKFVQADEAVSPVIGVILMVAITVVLAAVVFVLVSNLSKSGQKAPDVAFSTDETRDRITIVTAQNELTYADFEMKSSQSVGYYRNGQSSSDSSSVLTGLYQTFGLAAEEFRGGDFIDFCGLAQIDSPTTIQILHSDSNTVVYETTLNTIDICAP